MKIAIITLTASPNYGNFLQNYALQEVLAGYGCEVETIKNYYHSSLFVKARTLKKTISILLNYHGAGSKEIKRRKAERFYKKHIVYSKFTYSGSEKLPQTYDAYIVGSDQTWNPNFGVMTSLELLRDVPDEKRFSYAASFGVSNLNTASDEIILDMKNNFSKFRRLSVREQAGAEILHTMGVDDAEVHLDPTMLLTSEKWKAMLSKPARSFPDRFLAVYMLGEIPQEYVRIIQNLAAQYHAEVINILDKSSGVINAFEFLWMIANARCVCTDSFHATVFSILFHRDFYIFDREDCFESQNSRFKTLLEKAGIDGLNIITKNSVIQGFNVNWEQVDKQIAEQRIIAQSYLEGIVDKTE